MIASQRLLTTVCALVCITSTVCGAVTTAHAPGQLASPQQSPRIELANQRKAFQPSIHVPNTLQGNTVHVQAEPVNPPPKEQVRPWWTTEAGIRLRVTGSTTKHELFWYAEHGINIYNKLSQRDPNNPMWKRLANALDQGLVHPRCLSLVHAFLDLTESREKKVSDKRLIMETYLILITALDKSAKALKELNTFVVGHTECALKSLLIDDRFFSAVGNIKAPAPEKRMDPHYHHITALFADQQKTLPFEQVVLSILEELKDFKITNRKIMSDSVERIYYRIAYLAEQVMNMIPFEYRQGDVLVNVQNLIFFNTPIDKAQLKRSKFEKMKKALSKKLKRH